VHPQSPNVECVVKCLEGSVHLGDTVRVDDDHEARELEGFVVQEILYFDRMVSELEPNFGGKLLLSALGSPSPITPGADLIAISGRPT